MCLTNSFIHFECETHLILFAFIILNEFGNRFHQDFNHLFPLIFYTHYESLCFLSSLNVYLMKSEEKKRHLNIKVFFFSINQSQIVMIFVQKVYVTFIYSVDKKKEMMKMTHKLLRGKAIKVFYQCYNVNKRQTNDVETANQAISMHISCARFSHQSTLLLLFSLKNFFVSL